MRLPRSSGSVHDTLMLAVVTSWHTTGSGRTGVVALVCVGGDAWLHFDSPTWLIARI
jgi:hypothetical protein